MKTLIAATILLVGTVQSGQAKDSASVAVELGSVIASEELCGLTYNQAAIRAFIEKNVDADDTQFAVTLEAMVETGRWGFKDTSSKDRALHADRRVAKSFGSSN